MSIFDVYCDEFFSLENQISLKINELDKAITGTGSSVDTSSIQECIRCIDKLFLDINEIMKQLSFELRSFESAPRAVANKKLDSFKINVSNLQQQFTALKNINAKTSLLSSSGTQNKVASDLQLKYELVCLQAYPICKALSFYKLFTMQS
jgi:t-SNARE complex subunit (syntaxin)